MATAFLIDGVNWDDRAFAQSEKNVAQITVLYNDTIRQITRIVDTIELTSGKPFSFNNYPQIRVKVDKLLAALASKIQGVVTSGTQEAWAIANAKNDALIEYMEKQTGISASVLKNRYNYGARNADALKAFQKRKTDGLRLSDRIWNATQQARGELETVIDIGLSEGKSAAALSRDIKSALLEPNRIYRKVKGPDGKMRLSKAAATYHPGRGVYRSSYKNAMRVARTEINMAYRESDYQRWKGMDFIKGIQVNLSNNPHHCPTCEALQGLYPKDFKFIGWHPQCRCYAVPVLLSDDEYNDFEKAVLNGEDYEPKGTVKDVPDNFSNWIDKNKSKIEAAKSKPYFIRDNQGYLNGKKSSYIPEGLL